MSANAHKTVIPVSISPADDVHTDSHPIRRVLLVDEQAHVLRVIRLNLEREGYSVDAALNSEHALLLMSQHSYDALIMTSDMPDMSTRQLCVNADRYCRATVPLILVNDSREDEWIDQSDVVERLSAPVSLRWIVARLGEEFGDNAN